MFPRFGRRAALAAAAAILFSQLPGGANAQNFERPVRIIVPYAPGGTSDILARLISPKLSAAIGQSVVVENKPGAAGNLGADAVAKAQPDGHTLLLMDVASLATAPSLFSDLTFDVEKDLAPISMVMFGPYVLAVHESVPAKSTKELIDYAKANPGKLSFASANTSGIVAGETLKHFAELDMLHVPYKSSPPALNDVIGGRITMMFIDVLTGLPHVNGGALRALAVTTRDRSPLMSKLPSMQEGGVPDFDITSWQGYFGPAGLPKEIVAKLNAEIRKIVEKPEIKAQLATLGMDAFSGTPEELGTFVRDQLVLWEKLVTNAGIEKQ